MTRAATSARATPARAASQTPHYAGTFVFTNDFAALLADTPTGRMDEQGLLRRAQRAGPLPGALLLAAPRPDAGRDGAGGDPPRGGRLGGAVRRDRRASLHQLCADLREQGRDDGRQQPASARPDLGQRDAAQRDPQGRRHPAGLSADAGVLPAVRLSAARVGSGRADRLRRTSTLSAVVPFWAIWPFETHDPAARGTSARCWT